MEKVLCLRCKHLLTQKFSSSRTTKEKNTVTSVTRNWIYRKCLITNDCISTKEEINEQGQGQYPHTYIEDLDECSSFEHIPEQVQTKDK